MKKWEIAKIRGNIFLIVCISVTITHRAACFPRILEFARSHSYFQYLAFRLVNMNKKLSHDFSFKRRDRSAVKVLLSAAQFHVPRRRGECLAAGAKRLPMLHTHVFIWITIHPIKVEPFLNWKTLTNGRSFSLCRRIVETGLVRCWSKDDDFDGVCFQVRRRWSCQLTADPFLAAASRCSV